MTVPMSIQTLPNYGINQKITPIPKTLHSIEAQDPTRNQDLISLQHSIRILAYLRLRELKRDISVYHEHHIEEYRENPLLNSFHVLFTFRRIYALRKKQE